MVGYDTVRDELEELGVKLVGASVDPEDEAREVADEVYFPIGHGVPRSVAEMLGAFWEERRRIIQPCAFVLDPAGMVLASCYSDGPLGRIEAADAVRFVRFQRSRA